MSQSIVRQLVLKDLYLMRVPIICYWVGGLLAIAIAVFGGDAFGLPSFILFVVAMAAAGVHPIIATIVEERKQHTLAFVMSLPVTIRGYTSAKLIANLLMFLSVWVTLSLASFVVFLGDGGMPDGTIPFGMILLVGILVAYTIILAVSLVSESEGGAIVAIVVGNVGTQLFLFFVADLYTIRSVMGGRDPVWNATAVGILLGQLTLVLTLIAGTYYLQARKKDFIS